MYDLQGRLIPERCECGRFMRHVWYRTGEHDDDWQDTWKCSNPIHQNGSQS